MQLCVHFVWLCLQSRGIEIAWVAIETNHFSNILSKKIASPKRLESNQQNKNMKHLTNTTENSIKFHKHTYKQSLHNHIYWDWKSTKWLVTFKSLDFWIAHAEEISLELHNLSFAIHKSDEISSFKGFQRINKKYKRRKKKFTQQIRRQNKKRKENEMTALTFWTSSKSQTWKNSPIEHNILNCNCISLKISVDSFFFFCYTKTIE